MEFLGKIKTSLLFPGKYGTLTAEAPSRAIWYLVKLSCLIALIISLFIGLSLNKEMNNLINLAKKAPDFSFSNGQLVVKAKMPLVIKETKNSFIMVDTSNNDLNSLMVLSSRRKDSLIVTKDRILSREDGQVKITELAQFKSLSFNKEQLLKNSRLYKFAFILIPAILIILLDVGGKLVGMLVLSLLGLLICALAKRKFSFTQIRIFCCYALTAPIILSGINWILLHFSINVPNFGLVYCLVWLIYFWLVISSPDNQPAA